MRRLLILLALLATCGGALTVHTPANAAEGYDGRASTTRFRGKLKVKEQSAPATPPSGWGYIYIDTSGAIKYINDAGTTYTLSGDGAEFGSNSTNILLVDADDDIKLDDGTTLAWTDGNGSAGTNDLILARAAAAVLSLGGLAVGEANMRFLEDSDNGANYVAVKVPASVSSNATFVLDVVNYTGLTALPARTLFETVSSAGARGTAPAAKLLYAGLAESAAHLGSTAAETSIMPATGEGSVTVAIADLLGGAVFEYNVLALATPTAAGDETLTVNVYLGAQLVGTSGAIAIDNANTPIVLRGVVNLEAAGASIAGNYLVTGTPTATGAAFTAFDTTATKAFDVKLDWGGTTDGSDTSTVQIATISLVNVD